MTIGKKNKRGVHLFQGVLLIQTQEQARSTSCLIGIPMVILEFCCRYFVYYQEIYYLFLNGLFSVRIPASLKQMTAEFSNHSDRNSGQESRWLSHDVYFSHSSVDTVNVPLNQFSWYDRYFAYNGSKGIDTSRVPFLRRSCN